MCVEKQLIEQHLISILQKGNNCPVFKILIKSSCREADLRQFIIIVYGVNASRSDFD